MSLREKVNCFVFQSVVYIEHFKTNAAVGLRDVHVHLTRLHSPNSGWNCTKMDRHGEILHLGVELLSRINASIDPN